MKHVNVYWSAVGSDGFKYSGKLPFVAEGTSIADIESKLFEEVEPIPNIKNLWLRTILNDESGSVCCYEKRGKTWVQVQNDNILPWCLAWFGLFFLGLIATMLLVLGIYSFR